MAENISVDEAVQAIYKDGYFAMPAPHIGRGIEEVRMKNTTASFELHTEDGYAFCKEHIVHNEVGVALNTAYISH
jgi:hypothetical protein